MAPKKPRDEAFDTIVKVLTQHLSPEPSEIYETFRFQSRVQKEGESVADYPTELRKIADHCGFGDALERNLRDRFFIGLREKTVQRILLAKPKKLMLKKALDTALAAELAMQNANRLPGSRLLPITAGDVNALRFKKHKGRQQKTSGAKTAKMKGPVAHINLKKDVNPKFCKARSLLYAVYVTWWEKNSTECMQRGDIVSGIQQ